MSKKYLRVYYLDMFRGTNNHFIPLQEGTMGAKDDREKVEDIIADITESGGLWISDAKIIPVHRILGYEICDEESVRRIEESRERKQREWKSHDRYDRHDRRHRRGGSYSSRYQHNISNMIDMRGDGRDNAVDESDFERNY